MLSKNQKQNHLDNSKEKENSKAWKFIACPKLLIAKRDEKYLIIKLPSGWSAIINAKFVRKKESDDNIYMSIPSDYKINARCTRYNSEKKTYDIVETRDINYNQLVHEIIVFRKAFNTYGLPMEDILDYDFIENEYLKDVETPF